MLSRKAKRELKIDQRQILIDSIEIGVPSPEQILKWGERDLPNGKKAGLVKNSKTVNYKRFTPFRDGLFCERIFGPVTSFVCACGKKQPHAKISFCEKCEVQYTDQRSRRYRLGYISLLSPVTHIWYLKGRPSYLSLFLGKRKKTVLGLAYCNSYLVEHGIRQNFGKDNFNERFRQVSTEYIYSSSSSANPVCLRPYARVGNSVNSKSLLRNNESELQPCVNKELSLSLQNFAAAKQHLQKILRYKTSYKTSALSTKGIDLEDSFLNAQNNKFFKDRSLNSSAFCKSKNFIRSFAYDKKQSDEQTFLRQQKDGQFYIDPPKQNIQSSNSIAYKKNIYTRHQTLPFLPTLVCNLYLRDAILDFLYSSATNHDTPLVTYCNNERWQPLRNVHKFMAEQTIYNFKESAPILSELPVRGVVRSKVSFYSRDVVAQILPTTPISGDNTLEFCVSRQLCWRSPIKPFLRSDTSYKLKSKASYKTKNSYLNLNNTKQDSTLESKTTFSTLNNRFVVRKNSISGHLLLNNYSLGAASKKFSFLPVKLSAKLKESKVVTSSLSFVCRTLVNSLLSFAEQDKKLSADSSFLFNKNEDSWLCKQKLPQTNLGAKQRENEHSASLASLYKSEFSNWKQKDIKKPICQCFFQSCVICKTKKFVKSYPSYNKQTYKQSFLERSSYIFGSLAFTKSHSTQPLSIRYLGDLLSKEKKISCLFSHPYLFKSAFPSIKRNVSLSAMFLCSSLFRRNKGTTTNKANLSRRKLLFNKAQENFLSDSASINVQSSLFAPSLFNLQRSTFRRNVEDLRKLSKKVSKNFCKSFVSKKLGARTSETRDHDLQPSTMFSEAEQRHTRQKPLFFLAPRKLSSLFSKNFLSKSEDKVFSKQEAGGNREGNASNGYSSAFYSAKLSTKTSSAEDELFSARSKTPSSLELTAIREILSYTGGGALKQILQQFNTYSFEKLLTAEIEILRNRYKTRIYFQTPSLSGYSYDSTDHTDNPCSPLLSKNLNQVGSGDRQVLKQSNTNLLRVHANKVGEYQDLQKKSVLRLSRRIYKESRRLKIVQLLTRNNRRPEWMILSYLPVLPPDLRPILQMGENLIVASDLNNLYQRVIYRNNRHFRLRFIDFHLVTAIQRLVQDAVDRLIENGKGGSKPYYTPGGRPLKSLSDTLKGKKGRFRLNLLGKRVDFSGRSVIVVSPSCKIHECGLPRDIALELYHYFLLRQLILKNHCASIVIAKRLIKERSALMWDILRDLIYHHPILLNRAPTLHRLGIQAFQPKLVLGNAILLHPLVCSAFNADFDGDQMGVHLPLCFSARAESWDLLWSRNNLLSPATGQPMLVPSQDMVLGFYYMTALASSLYNPDKIVDLEQNKYSFSNTTEIIGYLQKGNIFLHTPIWLKWNGKVENDSHSQTIELRINTFGESRAFSSIIKYSTCVTKTQFFNKKFKQIFSVKQLQNKVLYQHSPYKTSQATSKPLLSKISYSRQRKDSRFNLQHVRTTAGRVLVNNIL